ncbi:ABC transporter substrate-binding protein [Marinobacter sp. ATCH36]|uniref:ABC transporter substrate-binding protein n=1 Tax=Marinobacter sp. ATCH36 TaxID=2945106 RepID=UPI002021C74D|nr:ABC transporter substrate-binding protein [Marinobacter sp. ATCH36]MCL7944720.1 ABC transporter substrate-binding protein [Marinobacter sp. ATCH36]
MKATENPNIPARKGSPATRWLLVILALFLIVTPSFHPAVAQSATGSLVYLAGSENSALNRRMLSLLEEAMGSTTIIRSFSRGQTSQDSTTPVIALGPEAFTRVRQENKSVPILALLVDESFIDGYAERSEGSVSGILYNPPLLRQAIAGKVILPQATRVAMLARPDTVEIYESVTEELPDYGLEGKVFIVTSDDRLIPTLIRALNYGDFILAAPDNNIYNPRTIKHILLTAYRRNRIVIGPSQAYVKAGSLASTYTPLTQIANLAADFVAEYRANGQLPSPAYPDNFSIDLNSQVARSMNIPLQDRQDIIRSVMEQLTGPEEAADE